MSSNNDFEIENGVLVKYTGAGGDVVIPDGVTSIGDWAFSRYEGLTSVTIPDSVTSIGDWAFCECASLTNIAIPDSVTSRCKDADRQRQFAADSGASGKDGFCYEEKCGQVYSVCH